MDSFVNQMDNVTVANEASENVSDFHRAKRGTGHCSENKRAALDDVDVNMSCEECQPNTELNRRQKRQASGAHIVIQPNPPAQQVPTETAQQQPPPTVSPPGLSALVLPSQEMEEDLVCNEAVLEDIDAGDQKYPIHCTEYVTDIYRYLKDVEESFLPSSVYLEVYQDDINATMRSILVDWLIEVAEEYRLNTHTLFLAVNFCDRFLSSTPVKRGQLQLVGVTCMLIAAKIEEMMPPSVDDFVYISDNTYSHSEIIAMERLILNSLKFKLTAPTVPCFLKRFVKASYANHHLEVFASYLAELALVEYYFIGYKPSMIAASCLFLAANALGVNVWTPLVEHHTEFSLEQIAPCVRDLHALHSRCETGPLQAVREKYKDQRFYSVANMAPALNSPL